MNEVGFDQSIFINCPFDKDYEPILQAILFCVIYLGFNPRLATERANAAENRIDKISELIQSSKYSIHDLSRCRAKKAGEYFRLNMPFELGIDYGCRRFLGNKYLDKKFLILEQERYRFQAAISDIAGCDIEPHGGNYQKAIEKVRNWLVQEAGAHKDGPSKILQKYTDFQEWNYERLLHLGHSEDDIQRYPTQELMVSMKDWMAAAQPATFAP